MIQWRLKELIAKKERLEGRSLPYRLIYKETGISPNTLSKIATGKIEQIGVSTIDRLCAYLDCEPGDLLVRVEG